MKKVGVILKNRNVSDDGNYDAIKAISDNVKFGGFTDNKVKECTSFFKKGLFVPERLRMRMHIKMSKSCFR